MFTMLININVYKNINQFNQRDWIAKENWNLCCLHAARSAVSYKLIIMFAA